MRFPYTSFKCTVIQLVGLASHTHSRCSGATNKHSLVTCHDGVVKAPTSLVPVSPSLPCWAPPVFYLVGF
jgi:hypothetical protein